MGGGLSVPSQQTDMFGQRCLETVGGLGSRSTCAREEDRGMQRGRHEVCSSVRRAHTCLTQYHMSQDSGQSLSTV